MSGKVRFTPAQRWAMSIELPDHDGGCWRWTASTSSGYGQFTIGADRRRQKVYAHRFSYERLIGPIAPDQELDHLCRNRACCNPVHLEPVPHRVNMERARRLVCARGHPMTVDNVFVRQNGARRCRTCTLADNRAASKRRSRSLTDARRAG